MQIYHANIVWSENRDKFAVRRDSYIAVENGIVEGIYGKLPEKYIGAPLTDYGSNVMIPAFSDLHVHAPQYPQRGLAMDELLHDWLEKHTFPLEARFADLDYNDEFDGIWACASLLHVPQNKLPTVMEKVERALKPEGVLYASFKYGEGERIVGERHFSFYNEYDLDWLSGLGLIEYWISEDVRPDRPGEKWLNTLWRKK